MLWAIAWLRMCAKFERHRNKGALVMGIYLPTCYEKCVHEMLLVFRLFGWCSAIGHIFGTIRYMTFKFCIVTSNDCVSNLTKFDKDIFILNDVAYVSKLRTFLLGHPIYHECKCESNSDETLYNPKSRTVPWESLNLIKNSFLLI